MTEHLSTSVDLGQLIYKALTVPWQEHQETPFLQCCYTELSKEAKDNSV